MLIQLLSLIWTPATAKKFADNLGSGVRMLAVFLVYAATRYATNHHLMPAFVLQMVSTDDMVANVAAALTTVIVALFARAKNNKNVQEILHAVQMPANTSLDTFVADFQQASARPLPSAATVAKVVLACVLLGGAGALAACAGHLTPKVAIDVSDRSVYSAARAFQTSVEADYQAHQAWPTFAERRKINVFLGGDPTCVPSSTVVCTHGLYDLVIDVANIGLSLPPGSQLSLADLRAIDELRQALVDLSSLVSPKAAQGIQDKVTDLKNKAGTLLANVKGATQ